jgi:hypothetical protein
MIHQSRKGTPGVLEGELLLLEEGMKLDEQILSQLEQTLRTLRHRLTLTRRQVGVLRRRLPTDQETGPPSTTAEIAIVRSKMLSEN